MARPQGPLLQVNCHFPLLSSFWLWYRYSSPFYRTNSPQLLVKLYISSHTYLLFCLNIAYCRCARWTGIIRWEWDWRNTLAWWHHIQGRTAIRKLQWKRYTVGLSNDPFIHPINCFSSFFIVPFFRYRNVPFQTCIRRFVERRCTCGSRGHEISWWWCVWGWLARWKTFRTRVSWQPILLYRDFLFHTTRRDTSLTTYDPSSDILPSVLILCYNIRPNPNPPHPPFYSSLSPSLPF